MEKFLFESEISFRIDLKYSEAHQEVFVFL